MYFVIISFFSTDSAHPWFDSSLHTLSLNDSVPIPLGAATKPKLHTYVNADRLAGVQFGDYEQFSFPGWHKEIVHGYVMKPWNYHKGKKYPVAFIVHGGPQGSMGNDFHYRWNPAIYAGKIGRAHV